jgi:hypothetical protein
VVSERRLCAVLALLSAGFVSPAALAASDADRKLSPKAAYQALIKVPRGKTALPKGYESPTLGPVPPSSTAKRHHAIGAVAISLTKPGTAGARILYLVFPTRADALADWKEASVGIPPTRLTPPSFLPRPSTMFNAAVVAADTPGKTMSFGTTTIAYVTGNFIVEVDTSSTSNKTQGDILGTIALAHFAAVHLASVTGPIAPVKPAKPAKPVAPIV